MASGGGFRADRLKPAAAVGDPPGNEYDRNSRRDSPPYREREVGQEAQKEEYDPEDFPLHIQIVGLRTISEGYTNGNLRRRQ